jgi:hypothetical protein|nr:hypothetical protein [Kofleriaceae bacterium]
MTALGDALGPIVVRKDRPFSVEELARRVSATLDGVAVRVATAEDTVIAKLEWGKLGASARQLDDVRRLVAIRAASLDRGYIERWVRELGLHDEWERAQAP